MPSDTRVSRNLIGNSRLQSSHTAKRQSANKVVKQRAPSLFSPGHVSSASPSPAPLRPQARSPPQQPYSAWRYFDILGVYNEELEDKQSEMNK
jgi:hypothetical protein